MLDFQVVKSRQKVSVVEKYDYPVLTIMPKVELDGHVQKFDFNKAASNVMNFDLTKDCYIGLAFNEEKKLVLVNLGDTSAKVSARVNKDCTFNSKKIYELLQKNLGFDSTVEHEFFLEITNDGEYTFANLLYEIIPDQRVSFNDATYEQQEYEDQILSERYNDEKALFASELGL